MFGRSLPIQIEGKSVPAQSLLSQGGTGRVPKSRAMCRSVEIANDDGN